MRTCLASQDLTCALTCSSPMLPIYQPQIMAAIAECTKNPMAIFNYQNDPEVGLLMHSCTVGVSPRAALTAARLPRDGRTRAGLQPSFTHSGQMPAPLQPTLPCCCHRHNHHCLFPFPAPAGAARV